MAELMIVLVVTGGLLAFTLLELVFKLLFGYWFKGLLEL